MSGPPTDINDLAITISELLVSDRDVTIGVGGFTGEGKTTFASKLAKAYAKVTGQYWGFDRMTWNRKELMKWIDGTGPEKEGQLPEYSVIVPDELFLMFYRRNWYEEGQVDAIGTLNMCRDRHLFIIGNVPNLWDLDSAFLSRLRFYVYIPQRGVAWIFQQENNPFGSDPWNIGENKKDFRKHKSPVKIANFICQIEFDDWDEEEKKEYYAIRNKKRVEAMEVNKSYRQYRASKLIKQRNDLIKWVWTSLYWKDEKGEYRRPTQVGMSEVVDMARESLNEIINRNLTEEAMTPK
jgi:hypothetical protein